MSVFKRPSTLMSDGFFVSKLLCHLILFAGVLLLSLPVQAQAFGIAKLKLSVIDENGQPVEDAQVSVRFQGGTSAKDRTIGRTDEEGVFAAASFSSDGNTGGGVSKEGYYTSVFHHDFSSTRFGVWQPWGKELSVVMRAIVNPVPMYVLDWGMKFPKFDEEIGFDLMKADWVIPFGQGTHADFIFKVERKFEDNRNYDVKLTLTFSNPHDGIQLVKESEGGDFNVGSKFRLPRIAPKEGYKPKFEKRLSSGSYGNYADWADDNNYIFRVRSEVDGHGNLTRAMYGKVRRNISVYASGAISMLYYLNPDYTRNLEFDVDRNLFSHEPEGGRLIRMP